MKKTRILIFCMVVLLVVSSAALAKHRHLEKWYQARWCNEIGGTMEYVLPDGARVDCLTEEYAIEFDFAPKWAESIGQALYYGVKTGKHPGVVLIMEHPDREQQFLMRLEAVGGKYGIKVWVIGE